MESLNDNELKYLLGLWVSPVAPRSLEAKLFATQFPWWRRLFEGILRRPLFDTRSRFRRSKGIRKV